MSGKARTRDALYLHGAIWHTPLKAQVVDAAPTHPELGPIRVYLVDDHPVVLSGLRALVQSQEDMLVVGEAMDGITAVEDAPRAAPHLIVMDVALPRLSGADATQRLRSLLPDVKILALSAHVERDHVQRLMKAGASGYLVKLAAGEDVIVAIRTVVAGKIYLDPSVTAHLHESGDTETGMVPLSQREQTVLCRIAEGYAMKEIAAELEVSTRTLETYRARAIEKLGIKSRAEIIQYALRRGWLKVD